VSEAGRSLPMPPLTRASRLPSRPNVADSDLSALKISGRHDQRHCHAGRHRPPKK
jgi:hypothetical protein